MPPRSSPTARQERLGAELRKMRERAGLTARGAGDLLGTGPVQISHIEAGRIGVSEARLRRLASHYQCADAELVQALVSMAAERERGWWEEFRGSLSNRSLDLAELECRASRLRNLEVVHVPGLLQTEDYIRAIHAYADPVPPLDHVEAVVAFRLKRRAQQWCEPMPPITAVVHEAALRIRVGSRKAARAQLDFLMEASEIPGLSVQIIPFDVDGFGGSGFSMLYADGQVPALDTVQLDAAHGSVFLDAEASLATYCRLFAKAEKAALGAHESRDLIRAVAQEL